MLSSIVATLIAIWFFNTAPRSGRVPITWAISGVVVYFLAAWLWSLIVTPTIKEAAIHNPSGLLIVVLGYAYIAFAASCALVLNAWLNKAK